MNTKSIRFALYAAVAVVLLTLSGIFTTFETRSVISGRIGENLIEIRLSFVFLLLLVGGTAYLAAHQSRSKGAPGTLLGGVVGGGIAGGALALTALLKVNADAALQQAGAPFDLRFFFPNMGNPVGGTLTLWQPELVSGLVMLLIFCAFLGLLAGVLHLLSPRLRQAILLSLAYTVVIGLLENQLKTVITLPDALALALVLLTGYGISTLLPLPNFTARVGLSVAVGAVIGAVLAVVANSGGLEAGGVLRGIGSLPKVLSITSSAGNLLPLMLIFGLIGGLGAVLPRANRNVHDSALYMIPLLIVLGMLNTQSALNPGNSMTPTSAVIAVVLLFVTLFFTQRLGEQAVTRYETLPQPQQRGVRAVGIAAGVILLLVIPLFVNQYIAFVLYYVGIYIVMGIGLNVVLGYAGLLDLGYVAFFAIGAYAVGVFTTPSLLTCGGVSPDTIAPDQITTVCTGVMTFWQAWPLAALVSALAGVMLGVPILRLRGDYLAIVTLGFGEIINRVLKSDTFSPLFGGAQGIAPIPFPVIDLTALNPAWRLEISDASRIYYLLLVVVIVAAAITTRLAHTRLGRAWRAMRSDEDVAQAMGINLVNVKLLAFAIGAAFAGLGGAVFGAYSQGIFPNTFTLTVSINVLALIIIGGMGSIPGVVIGAFMLIGMPEALRELEDYRLLAFGVLLVSIMLLRPQGLLPPQPPQLSERDTRLKDEKAKVETLLPQEAAS